MSSEGIRVAAYQVVGVSACHSDRREAGFIPPDTRVNPGRKTDLVFQLGKRVICGILSRSVRRVTAA